MQDICDPIDDNDPMIRRKLPANDTTDAFANTYPTALCGLNAATDEIVSAV